jgi:hypothetical protein
VVTGVAAEPRVDHGGDGVVMFGDHRPVIVRRPFPYESLTATHAGILKLPLMLRSRGNYPAGKPLRFTGAPPTDA